MKILLTGSSGFIGKTFLRRFGDRYDITPYDIVGGKDIRLFDDITPEDYDAVVHLAARAGVRKSHYDPEDFWDVNVNGSKKIFNEFEMSWRNIPIIYASSSSIYEWWQSPYATTKKVVEEIAPYNSLGLRFHTVYGDNSRTDMLYDKLLRKDVTYITNHTRDWTHVDDVCEAIHICIKNFNSLRRDHGAIDVGNGRPVTVKEMSDHIWPDNNLPIKDVEGERQNTCADPAVLLQYGWQPKHHILD